MTTNNQGFPQTNVPFIDNSGKLTYPWLKLLTSLWMRTGGGAGVPVPATNGTYTIGGKLTPGGNNGTITIVSGIITSVEQAS